jgi:L-amino acid N-acyltransferase YncA
MNSAPPAAVIVRDATSEDAAAIAAIYAHHVSHGLATFEETPPGPAEMERRVAAVVERALPYLVAELEGIVRGFAYAAPYRARPAYRFSVENSVYVEPTATRLGLGRKLLDAVVTRCTALGYRQMVAVIGDSANAGSIGLHAALGFRQAGVLRATGFKHGRWVDTVIMQRQLGDGDATLP